MGGPKMETMMTTNHATKKSYVFFYKLNRVTRGKFLPAGPKGEWTFTTLLYNHITRCILKFNVKICLYLTLWQFSSKSLRLSSVTAFCLHRNILLSTLFLKNVQSVSFLQSLNYLWSHKSTAGRLHLKCDATRAETRFCLSAKRMSPFKSLGVSVQLTTAAEVCASVVVMLDTPCSEVVWSYWIPTRFVSSPFTSPPVRHRVPSRFNWTLLHHPNLKLEDHPLSTVRDSLFITFSAALYDWRPSPSSATRGRTISWWQGPNYHG